MKMIAVDTTRRQFPHVSLAFAALALTCCDGGGGEDSPDGGDGAEMRENSRARSPDAPSPWFEEIAVASGLHFVHDSGKRELLLFPESVCGGAALFDMDGDGDLDAYLVQAGPLSDPIVEWPENQLFRNRGDGTFENVTEGSGADDTGYGMGVATGDYDNDGDIDLYVTNLGANILYRNDGGGRFTDVTVESRVGDPEWGAGAAFLDYDADGDLDLYVANYVHWSVETEKKCYLTTGEYDYCAPNSYEAPAEDTLYRNNGDGTFDDVSVEAGIHAAFGNGLGVVCGDFNGDRLIDIYVANDGMKNQMWINNGDGTFRDEAPAAGTALDQDGAAKAGMGVCAIDFDDDDDLDILVVNLVNETDSFYRNEGDYFVDDTIAVGLRQVSRLFTRFGVACHDFDNDGRLDLFQANGRVRREPSAYGDDPYAEPNVLYSGNDDGGFTELTLRGGTAEPLIATSRAAAFGDIDNDGAIDILVLNRDGPAHLLRNVATDRGNWIMFQVIDEHGRDALGAVVSVQLGERRIRRDVRTAYSYCAANDPRVHVGLGTHNAVQDVTVRWPDGDVELFGEQAGGAIITLRRGAGQLTDG